MMARTVLDLLKAGRDAAGAAQAAVKELEAEVAGSGGVIVVDASGGIGIAFNTACMAHAGMDGTGRWITGI